MLKKIFRLKKRSAFTATYKSGKSLHRNGITLFYGKEKNNDKPTKIGFVVSKRIHKRAVKRNRIKRLMREAVRLYIKSCGDFDTKYISLIFAASAKLLEQNFDKISKTVNELIGKAAHD